MGEDASNGSTIVVSDCRCFQNELTYNVTSIVLNKKEVYHVFGGRYLKGAFPIVLKGFSVNDDVGEYIKKIDEAMNQEYEKLIGLSKG